ncbi:ABC transporter permease [Paratissierella segnis]|jgi:ribose/xylose/arabinose/galactoside ABC-type transport system permease subunit|nr:ABC transporter permease [Paratissierella segnis]
MEKLENKNKLSTFMNKHGIIFILLVMIIVSTIMEPSFLNYKNLINVFRQISVTGPIAIGMTFVIINGGIDISVGGIVGLAGMVAMILMSKGYGILIALLAALAIGILVGFINGYYVSKGLAPFIVTMSTNTILRGLAQLTTNGQPVWGIANGYEIFGQGYIGFVPVPVIIFLLVFAVAYIILNHTTIGRSVYAVGGNAESSRLSGISILKSKIFVYCISGILSAITAIVLTSRLASSDPTIGLDYQVDAIAATVIGGTSMSGGEGRVEKTLVGILIIGILSNILNLAGVSPYIQQVVKGLIILGAVVWDNSKRKNK